MPVKFGLFLHLALKNIFHILIQRRTRRKIEHPVFAGKIRQFLTHHPANQPLKDFGQFIEIGHLCHVFIVHRTPLSFTV